jgi:hypothetical protein
MAKESLSKLKPFVDLMEGLPTVDTIAIIGVFLTDFVNNGSDIQKMDRKQQWQTLKAYLDYVYEGLTKARDAGIKEGYDYICELFDDEDEKPKSRIII